MRLSDVGGEVRVDQVVGAVVRGEGDAEQAPLAALGVQTPGTGADDGDRALGRVDPGDPAAVAGGDEQRAVGQLGQAPRLGEVARDGAGHLRRAAGGGGRRRRAGGARGPGGAGGGRGRRGAGRGGQQRRELAVAAGRASAQRECGRGGQRRGGRQGPVPVRCAHPASTSHPGPLPRAFRAARPRGVSYAVTSPTTPAPAAAPRSPRGPARSAPARRPTRSPPSSAGTSRRGPGRRRGPVRASRPARPGRASPRGAAATRRSPATIGWFAAIISAVNRGCRARRSSGSKPPPGVSVPVRKPLPSGIAARKPMPRAAHHGSSSSSASGDHTDSSACTQATGKTCWTRSSCRIVPSYRRAAAAPAAARAHRAQPQRPHLARPRRVRPSRPRSPRPGPRGRPGAAGRGR